MRKVHPQGFENHEKGSTFKIMSYNLLSDENLKKNGTHLLSDDPCLEPMYRYRRILAEIEQANADIICLQEVSLKTAYPFFAKELIAMGYHVITLKKQEGIEMTATEKQEAEKQKLSHPRYWEILTAFKKGKFELLEKEEVDFFRVNLDYLNHNPEDFKRSNKGMLLLLQSVSNPTDKLVLANTQLYLGD